MSREITFKQRIIALFFTVLFIGYVGNVHFFVHEHKVGETVVVHSHLGSSTHDHTSNAINTIFSISHYDTTSALVWNAMDLEELLLRELHYKEEVWVSLTKIDYFSLRAPPVL